jgi:hypothetical protein
MLSCILSGAVEYVDAIFILILNLFNYVSYNLN